MDLVILTGLHLNEGCTAAMADLVIPLLEEAGLKVEHLPIPPEYTLLGYLDVLDNAVSDCCVTVGNELDMDLDRLAGDPAMHKQYPGIPVFEFHNYDAACRNSRLGILPGTPPGDFRLGDIGPDTDGAFELGWWRNRPGREIPGKYLVEIPAIFTRVKPDLLTKRLEHLNTIEADDIHFPNNRREEMIRLYFETAADPEASRRDGLLGPVLAAKISNWILTIINNR
ncbi:hypothetical protein ACFL4W_01225 [Planctomycetota bacterium]